MSLADLVDAEMGPVFLKPVDLDLFVAAVRERPAILLSTSPNARFLSSRDFP
jgi:hypothetical protein